MHYDADLIVVGSGPAGAQAAKQAVQLGLSVITVDVGESDRRLAETIPPQPFSELRRSDETQARYFVGDIDEAEVSGIKPGAHLTPPRKYVVRGARERLPFESTTFSPVMSLAMGGLGAAWGAGCETLTRAESERVGLDFDLLRPMYDEVARDIGISGDLSADIASNMAAFTELQPSVAIDENASTILRSYERRREELNASGFRLGKPPIAMLSRAMDEQGVHRGANSLRDMEMYDDADRSVYRPWYTIEALRNHPAYRYVPGMLALQFTLREGGVDLVSRDLASGSHVRFHVRRVVLAAGAINTARIVLHSLGAHDRRRPLLCNPYRYLPAINLHMLGRPARDERHSLAQLAASLATSADDPEQIFVALYSYRSLLMYRLVAQMPLPPRLGLLAARILLSSLTVLGVHFPDRQTTTRWLAVGAQSGEEPPTVHAEYTQSVDERTALERGLGQVRAAMRALGLLPLALVDPGNGSSIHYAGPLPFSPTPVPLGTAPDGHLYDAPHVYVADSAPWRFLPSKGPTLTIMAQARLVAQNAARDLRATEA